jgi:hypothetical protein
MVPTVGPGDSTDYVDEVAAISARFLVFLVPLGLKSKKRESSVAFPPGDT